MQESRSVLTQTGGILHNHTRPGDLAYKDQDIAEVMDPFETAVEHIIAPETGLIINISTNSLVNLGNEVFSYIMLDRSLEMVEAALKSRQA